MKNLRKNMSGSEMKSLWEMLEKILLLLLLLLLYII